MWSGVLYSPYNSDTESIFCANGTYRKRIEKDQLFEWGIEAADDVPTLSVGESTGLTGDYNAKYTYARKERNTVVCESNPSSAATAVQALSNESLEVVANTPTDGQVNCIRFYRTEAGGSIYYHDKDLNWANGDYGCVYDWEEDDEYFTGKAYRFTMEDTDASLEYVFTWEPYRNDYAINDNQDKRTVFGDNVFWNGTGYALVPTIDLTTADASLGSEVDTDHNRPPQGSFVAGPSFNGTIFMLYKNRLYFSKPKEPEYFPSSYYVDVGSVQFPGKCLVFYDKQPYVINKTKIFYIYGTTAATFLPQDVAAKTGTTSPAAAVAVEGYGIFHVGSDGVYMFIPSGSNRAGNDIKVTPAFDPIFRGESVGGVNAVGSLSNCWLHHWSNKVYFGYAGENDTYPTNILVFYLDEKRIGYFTRGQEIHALGVDNTNDRLLAVDGDGYVWEIEDQDVTTDEGTAISWEVESKDYTLQTRRHFPRWVKYDVDATDPDCSATGELILDGVSHHSHTISNERNTRRRLVPPGNGRRCSLKISGSGPVEIYMIESE